MADVLYKVRMSISAEIGSDSMLVRMGAVDGKKQSTRLAIGRSGASYSPVGNIGDTWWLEE